jgi:prepilin signal peptidase PulO-like enzyme (type II secretory pathway)
LKVLEAGPHPGQILLGALAFGGPYAVLHFVSRGRWVGLGDAKLGAALGPVLGWEKGLLALGIANVLGVLVAVPARKSRLPMAPFLAAAFVMVGLAQWPAPP